MPLPSNCAECGAELADGVRQRLCPQCGAIPNGPASAAISRRFIDRSQTMASVVFALVLLLLWVGYGFWIQHGFLVWESEHPHEIKPPGFWSQPELQPSGAPMWLLLLLVFPLENLLARRKRRRILTGRLVGRRLLAGLKLAGVCVVAVGVLAGCKSIEAWLWAKHALPERREAMREGLEKQLQSLTQLRQTLGPERHSEAVAGAKEAWQRNLSDVEHAARAWSLLSALLCAALVVWRGGALSLQAVREQCFVSYASPEEEAFERMQAASEELLEAEGRAAADRYAVLKASLASLIFLSLGILAQLMWSEMEDQPRASFYFSFVMAAGFVLGLTGVLWNHWSRGRFRRTAGQLLFFVSLAVCASTLLRWPNVLTASAAGYGLMVGLLLGCFIRWCRRKRIATT